MGFIFLFTVRLSVPTTFACPLPLSFLTVCHHSLWPFFFFYSLDTFWSALTRPPSPWALGFFSLDLCSVFPFSFISFFFYLRLLTLYSKLLLFSVPRCVRWGFNAPMGARRALFFPFCSQTGVVPLSDSFLSLPFGPFLKDVSWRFSPFRHDFSLPGAPLLWNQFLLSREVLLQAESRVRFCAFFLWTLSLIGLLPPKLFSAPSSLFSPEDVVATMLFQSFQPNSLFRQFCIYGFSPERLKPFPSF